MLRFQLTPSALATAEWRWAEDRWWSGDSHITPLVHPALDHKMITDGRSVAVLSRERRRSDPPSAPGAPTTVDTRALHAAVHELRDWPLDHTAVVLEADGVLLHAGTWAVTPLYLTANARCFVGSWDATDLRHHVETEDLDEVEVARLLSRRHRYGHSTVWAGIRRLTERSTARWQDGRLSLRYPSAAWHTHPRPLRPGADVLPAFEEVLDRAVNRRAVVPGQCAVELSGGLDSSNVAATLARRHPGSATAVALLIGGSVDLHQRRRREVMIESFGLAGDIGVPVADCLPFGPASRRARGEPTSPYAEPWLEAKQVMMTRMQAADLRWSFGGSGGDELTALRDYERVASPSAVPAAPWMGKRTVSASVHSECGIAPATVIHESTLLAFASRAAQYLRFGIWPVSPLADPEVIRFCEWLPLPWRELKSLQRLRLARLGLELDVYSQPRDDPRESLNVAIHRHVLPYLAESLKRGGILLDGGFVDPDGLARSLDVARRLRRTRQVDRSLFQIAALEAGLRSCSSSYADDRRPFPQLA